jgi:ferredoxin
MDNETQVFTPARAAVQYLRRTSPGTIRTPDDVMPRGNTAAPRRAMLRVHPERCQGHARCSEFLPELLTQDEYGPVQLKGDGAIPSPLFERARLAVACCPELAIKLLYE